MALIFDALCAGVASLGFAVLFSMPPRLLGLCVFAAVLGYIARVAVMQFGLGIEVGTLIGALVIGVMAELFSSRAHTPAMVFAVPAAIPFVPGAFAFKSVMGFATIASTGVQVDPTVVAEALANFFRAIFILGAIAAGISLPGFCFFRRGA